MKIWYGQSEFHGDWALGPLFADEDFAALFAWRGQWGVSTGLLALRRVLDDLARLVSDWLERYGAR